MKKQIFAAAAAIALTGLTGVSTAYAATTTEGVGERDVTRQAENTPPTDDWVLYTRTAASTGTFMAGPAQPPLGAGSLELATPGGGDKVFLFNYDHVGTDLGDVDAISYSTYRSAGSLQQVAALNLQVDFNGPSVTGGFTTLVFEPVYNTDQGPVLDNVWQEWDAINTLGTARWWSTRAINGVSAGGYATWATITAANPDAVILGGVGVNQGSGNPGLVTNVDAFTFDETTYDFDIQPTSKDDCKHGGHENYSAPSFKNQGDCVSFVSNGK